MKSSHSPTVENDISVRRAIQTSLSVSTRRAYWAAWRRFVAYCDELGLDPLAATPGDVAQFLVRMASIPGLRELRRRRASRLRWGRSGSSRPRSTGGIATRDGARQQTTRKSRASFEDSVSFYPHSRGRSGRYESSISTAC